MREERSPTEIDDPGNYWLRAVDVTGRPRSARDPYFPRYGVIRPANLTAEDLPPADDEAVAELDREALEETFVSGKWLVFPSPDAVDDVWAGVVGDVADGAFWDAKVATATCYEELDHENYVVCVYLPNYFDREDVDRVRERLRSEHGIDDELRFKPDVYTTKGIYPPTAEEFGLESEARYRE